MLTQSTLLPSLLFHFQKSKTRLSYLEDWPWFYAWILSLRFRVFRHPAGLCDTWQSLNHNDFNCACICKIFTYNILKGLFVRKVDFWVPFTNCSSTDALGLWDGLVGAISNRTFNLTIRPCWHGSFFYTHIKLVWFNPATWCVLNRLGMCTPTSL